MNYLIIDITISPEEYQKLYRQAIRNVNAQSRDGRRVQFPVAALRQFVDHNGIRGSFRIGFDQDNKLQSFQRI